MDYFYYIRRALSPLRKLSPNAKKCNPSIWIACRGITTSDHGIASEKQFTQSIDLRH